MPRTRQDADVKRREIARSARDVFMAHGLDGARTSDIAAAAGVTETILYRHFRSKQEIFDAAVLVPIEHLAGDLLGITQQFRHLTAERQLELSREAHRKLCMVISEIAPLIGVALFSNHQAGVAFYSDRLAPVFDDVVKALAEAMPRRVREVIEPRTFFMTIFGMYLSLWLDADLRDLDVDVDEVAADVTDLIAFGAFAEPR